MTLREGLGLFLLIGSALTAPFAYFVGSPWGWIALGAGLAGAALLFTARISRRFSKDRSGPEFGGELTGFPGHRIFRVRDSDAQDDE